MKYAVVYTRFNAVRALRAWELEAAKTLLQEQEHGGHISGVGVFDEDTRTLHVPTDHGLPFANGDGITDYYGQLRRLGIDVKRIKTYEATEGVNV